MNQMNLKTISNFITQEEKNEIIDYSKECLKSKNIDDEHVRKINELTYGGSLLCDFSKSKITKEIIQYQGGGTFVETVPELFHSISDRISDTLKISKENVFFQCIVLGAGGKVSSHYDAGIPDYITYKCNIYVDGPEDQLFIDKLPVTINPSDLYCFEANLYKHWVDTSNKQRVHLSYGFILPYEDLGWEKENPRIRLGERIWKTFIHQRYLS